MSRFLAVLPLLAAVPAAAQVHAHGDGEAAHHHGLHFSHPLITESVSPDTKLRVNAGHAREGDDREWELEFEGEYAFHRSFSIEVGLPWTSLRPAGIPGTSGIGNLEIAAKFANYAFEDRGVLLGYGLELGLPTGEALAGIGSDHLWEATPFLNAGYRTDRVELVGWTRFAIPFGQQAGEEVETEFLYDASLMVHATPSAQVLIELNGASGMSGPDAGTTVLTVSPGVRVAPIPATPLILGLGASLPVRGEAPDVALRLAVFWHF